MGFLGTHRQAPGSCFCGRLSQARPEAWWSAVTAQNLGPGESPSSPPAGFPPHWPVRLASGRLQSHTEAALSPHLSPSPVRCHMVFPSVPRTWPSGPLRASPCLEFSCPCVSRDRFFAVRHPSAQRSFPRAAVPVSLLVFCQ